MSKAEEFEEALSELVASYLEDWDECPVDAVKIRLCWILRRLAQRLQLVAPLLEYEEKDKNGNVYMEPCQNPQHHTVVTSHPRSPGLPPDFQARPTGPLVDEFRLDSVRLTRAGLGLSGRVVKGRYRPSGE